MIDLKGKGSHTDRSLIVTIPDNGKKMSKKDPNKVVGYFVDVELDQTLKNKDKVKEGKSTAQTDPHLVSTPVQYKGKDGKTKYATNHRTFYTADQVDKMRKAAKAVEKNHKPKVQMYGKDEVLGIKASITSTNHGYIINTAKPMAATDNYTFGKNIKERQNAVTGAAKDHEKAVYEASKSDPIKDTSKVETKDNDVSKDGPSAEQHLILVKLKS